MGSLLLVARKLDRTISWVFNATEARDGQHNPSTLLVLMLHGSVSSADAGSTGPVTSILSFSHANQSQWAQGRLHGKAAQGLVEGG